MPHGSIYPRRRDGKGYTARGRAAIERDFQATRRRVNSGMGGSGRSGRSASEWAAVGVRLWQLAGRAALAKKYGRRS